MSMYCKVETQFKNHQALINALSETSGWDLDQIEYYVSPINLYGYRGDIRNEKANIIIRKNFVGSASNDIGFRLDENNTYQAIISQYDMSKYGDRWMKRLKQNYAFHCIKLTQEAKGRKVVREKLEDGRQRIQIKIGR